MGLRRDAQTDELFRSILSLRSVEECYLYFEDLCTNKEVRDLGQRLTIAKLLREGSSYLQAAEALGVSSATIGRVKRCLDYGNGGYKMILDRMETEEPGDD
ncbi:MAG: helix-turn-helix domain-containing protein [Clostridia bacterium]|nr:helix-turn-helix domain-containing protein [Clostridia bacterium]